jgi:hypothetical protein
MDAIRDSDGGISRANGDGEREGATEFWSLLLAGGNTGGEIGLGECEGDECELGERGGVPAIKVNQKLITTDIMNT